MITPQPGRPDSRLIRQRSPHYEIPHSRRGNRRRRDWLQRALPPDQTGLDRHHADRAFGADVGFDLARGGRLSHAQRRHQHGGAARLHDPALPRARGNLRPVLRPAPRRRSHSGRDARPHGFPQGRTGEAPLHGSRDRDHRTGRDPQVLARYQYRRRARRALRSARRPPRPVGHDPSVCLGGAHGGRRDRAAKPGARDQPATRWRLGRGHRKRHDHRRACRQRGRPLGPRSRRAGRRLSAAPPDGAPVSGDRGYPRGLRERARAAPCDGPRGRELSAPRGPWPGDRLLRAGLRALGGRRHAGRFRPRAAQRQARPHRRRAGVRLPALSGARARRHQEHRQRAVHLRDRRQPAGRPGTGSAQLLVGLRGHGGAFRKAAASA